MTASDPNTIVVVVTGKLAGQLQAPDGSHDFDAVEQDAGYVETHQRNVAEYAGQRAEQL